MSESPPAPFFDAQAESFQARAGLPANVKREVADAIVEVGRLGTASTVLDVGAGTGDVGLELVIRGIGYIGLDASSAMLEQFRVTAETAGFSPRLLVADAGEPWPVAPGSVAVVFGSRSLHWLDPAHVAAQAFTVASPHGARLLIGRVERAADSPRHRVRRAMRDLLAREGIPGRSGSRSADRLVEECVLRGGKALPRRVVAAFSVRTSVRDAIEGFRGKPGLAGMIVEETVKERILDDLTRFTTEAFGNIDTPVDSTEQYVLQGATLVEDA
jgi:ubiquinone/menaquinone biosynthesis C-methylase UbiE